MTNRIEKLERVADLHKRGMLSDEEFEREKYLILNEADSNTNSSENIYYSNDYQSSYSNNTHKARNILTIATSLIVISTFVYLIANRQTPSDVLRGWLYGNNSQTFSAFSEEDVQDTAETESPQSVINDINELSHTPISPSFRLEHQTFRSLNILNQIIETDIFHLINSGSEDATIEWVGINNRDDCLAVPIFDSNGTSIKSISVVGSNSTENIADILLLKVGQKIKLDTIQQCGRIISLRIKSNDQEIYLNDLYY